MPKSIRSFDRMIIPAPCDADWDSMIGNDRVRFCGHCNLHVTNLSSLTRREARHLVDRSEGRLCVRFVKGADGGVLTKQVPEKLHRISRRVSRIAAGAFSATLSLSSAAAQSGSASSAPTETTRAIPSDRKPVDAANSIGSVGGAVLDPMGAVVPNANITLVGPNSDAEKTATSSVEGTFEFPNLNPGNYQLRVTAPGFARAEITNIKIDQAPTHVDVTLEVGGAMMSGMVAFISPEEPLVKAVFEDNLEAVKALAFATPDIDARDKASNTTALEQAVENSNLEIVRTLLMAGAQVNTQSLSGRTPLMLLRENATVELVRELLSAGGQVNAQDESGGTALMNAAENCSYDVVKELLAAAAKLDLRDEEGSTALIFAARNEDPRVAKALLEQGAPINDQDNEGQTALMVAAEAGDPEVVKLLIGFNADVNATDNNGWSALMYVAETDDVESARYLLNAGADLSMQSKDGKTALALAKESPHAEMLKLLKSRGAPE